MLPFVASQVDFVILRETPDFLAVDKPAGVLVHPTKPGGPRTLWDELRALLAYEVANAGNISILTRLDRETSGIVLVAKTSSAARELSLALQAGRIEKTYEAIVFGWPEPLEWSVDAPILRLGEVEPFRVWLKRGVHRKGAPSSTRFKVKQRFLASDGTRLAHVEASPKTGRTHQIRVHLSHSGHPIVGDKIYARGEDWYLKFIEQGWTAAMQEALLLPRQALHASRLSFSLGGCSHTISSPLAADLRQLLSDNLPARIDTRRQK